VKAVYNAAMAERKKIEISPLRHVPSVDQLLRTDVARRLSESIGLKRVTAIARSVTTEIRSSIRQDPLEDGHSPQVLLADEPMSSLDPALSRSLMDLLRHINLEDRLTVITSLHVLDLAVGYGGRIIGLRAGRIVHDGPPAAMTSSVAQMIFGEISDA